MADNVIEVLIRSVVEGAQGIKGYQEQLNLFGKSAVSVGGDIDKFRKRLDELEKSLQGSAIRKGSEAYEFLSGALEGARGALEEFGSGTAQVIQSQQDLQTQLESTVTSLEQLSLFDSSELIQSTESIRRAQEQFEDLGEAGVESIRSIEKAGQDYEGAANRLISVNQKVADSYKKSLKSAEEFNKAASRSTAGRAATQAGVEYSKALQATSEKLSSFSHKLKEALGITSDLGGVFKDVGPAITQLGTIFNTFGVNAGHATGAMTNLSAAFTLVKAASPIAAVAAVAGGLAKLAKEASDAGVEMDRLARQTGFSTEALSGLKIIAEENDVSLEQVTTGVRFFQRNLGAAVAGSREAIQMFEGLGVSVDDLRRALVEGGDERLFEQIAIGFTNLGSEAAKARYQWQLFGRGGKDMQIVLQELATHGLDAAKKKAQELGLFWDAELITSAKQLNVQITTIKHTMEGWAVSIGNKVLPLLIDFIATYSKLFGLKFNLPSPTEQLVPGLQRDLTEARSNLARLQAIQKENARGLSEAEKKSLQEQIDQHKALIPAIEATIKKYQEQNKAAAPRVDFKPYEDAAKEAGKSVTTNLIQQRAEVAAGLQQIIAQQTGSIDALAASYNERIKAIGQTTNEQVAQFKKQNQGALTDTEFNRIFGKVIQGIEDAGEAQANVLRQQRDAAVQSAREQARAVDVQAVEAFAQKASGLAVIEKERLNILTQQGASVEAQLAQVDNLSKAEQAASAARIASLQAQKTNLEGLIQRRGQVEGARQGTLNQIEGVNTALERELELQRRLANETQRERENRLNAAQALTETSLQAEQGLLNSIVTAEQTRLDTLQQQNAPLEQQLQKLTQIAAAEAKARANAVEVLELQKNAREERIRQLENQDGREQEVARLRNELAGITGQLEQQRAINDQLINQGQRAVQLAIQRQQVTGGAALQAQLTQEESRLQVLNAQIQRLREQERPYSEILSVAAQLDEAEKARLRVQIAQQEQIVAQHEALLRVKAITPEQLQVEESRLAALKATAAAIAQNLDQVQRELRNQGRQMADDLATSFVDTFLVLMEDREATLSNVFANIGRTITTQFLRAVLATMLEKPLIDMLKEWGADVTQLYNRFGVGGALAGGVQQLLGLGGPKKPESQISGAFDTELALPEFGTMKVAEQTFTTSLTGAALAADTLTASLAQLAAANTGGSTQDAVQAFADAANEGVGDAGAAAALTAVIGPTELLAASLTAATAAADAMALSTGGASVSGDALAISLGAASVAGDTLALSAGTAAITLDTTAISAGALATALTTAAAAASAFAAAASAGAAASGGSSAGGFLGAIGKLFGSASPTTPMGTGALVIPRGIRAFAHGGMVRNGPVMGIIGEEGPEIVARMKPASSQDMMGKSEPKVSVTINGDITPRRPEMKPEDVIKIVVSNGNNTDTTGVGGMVRNIIKRNR